LLPLTAAFSPSEAAGLQEPHDYEDGLDRVENQVNLIGAVPDRGEHGMPAQSLAKLMTV